MIFQKELIDSLKINRNKIAIEDSERKLSYQQLLNAADMITSFLIDTKVDQHTFIGIQLHNREDLITSIIGIANARCVFVPLNRSLPENRLLAMVEDLNLNYIITSKDEDVSVWSSATKKPILFYVEDIFKTEINNQSETFQYPEFQPDDSVYVYFTSGTTGKPKGIVGKNDSLLQFIKWEISTFEINDTFRVSQFISPYFDAFLRDIFVPLLAGGTIVIPPPDEDFFTSSKMTAWIDANKIKLIHCVPSLFSVINHDQVITDNYKSLKYVLLSGEKIIPSELVRWYNTFDTAIQLVNLYGATETTMIRSCYRISPKDVSLSKIPIGEPIADTEFLVANEEFKPSGKLVPGELYIISKYLTKGYFNQPELNSQKFRAVKTERLGEAIAFKTGDKARILANGNIDLLGREDRQIKLRGIRIELDEIEYILCQSDHVKQAVVIKKENERNNDSLYAFVISAGAVKGSAFIEDYARKHLPDYMMPSMIKLLDKMPLLSNGKIDYQTLLKITEVSAVMPPVTPAENKLLTIWKEILGDKEISTDQSFHALGGSSLSIMRLISRIYSEFQVRIPLSEIFKNLTIAKQAKIIENLNKDKVLEINKTVSKPGYVLSSAQDRIYFHYLLNPASTAFNIPMAWEIVDKVDVKKVEDVLQTLVARHEAFRTAFENINGQIKQVITQDVRFTLERITVSEEQIDNAVLAFIRPFDLSVGSLIRAALFTTVSDKKVLVVDTHHIVCDGMSQAILFSEFSTLYSEGQLSPLEFQYKDYAEWESDFRKTDEYLYLRSYWLNNFQGQIPKLQLPTNYRGDALPSWPGKSTYFQIAKRELNPVSSFLLSQEISIFSGLFAMFYLFLAKITGQDDIIVGINTAGRVQSKLENIVGMFVKTLPIRFRLNADQNFSSFVKDIHELLIQSNSRQIYDLADIVRDLSKSKNEPASNLIDVMFVYQNFEIENKSINDLTFSPYKLDPNTAKYPITLVVSEDAETFYFKLEYSFVHFTEDDIALLIEEYTELMFRISSNTDIPLLDLFESADDTAHKLEEDIKFNFNLI